MDGFDDVEDGGLDGELVGVFLVGFAAGEGVEEDGEEVAGDEVDDLMGVLLFLEDDGFRELDFFFLEDLR